MRAIVVSVMLTWMGCQSGPSNNWGSVDDCAAIPSGNLQDDCWGHFIVDVFKTDSKRGMDIMQNKISSDSVRDYLWLEVTRKVDPTTTKFCQQIQSKTLTKRCQTLVSRPHLHRETLRGTKGKEGKESNQNTKVVPQRKPQ